MAKPDILQTVDDAKEYADDAKQQVESHKADDAIDVHLAKNIGLQDTANNFTATQLEGAMSELFQSVNDGKNLLETAIIDKEGTVSKVGPVALFSELDTGIRGISSGAEILSIQKVLVTGVERDFPQDISISPVDLSKSIVILNATGEQSIEGANNTYMVEFLNNTTVRVEKPNNNYDLKSIQLQVIEYKSGISVQHLSFYGSTTLISPVNVDKSYYLVSNKFRSNSPGGFESLRYIEFEGNDSLRVITGSGSIWRESKVQVIEHL